MAKNKDPQELTSDTLMLAYLCIKDIESLKEKVAILDRFDLSDAAIGKVVGKKGQAIRDARWSAKKQPSKAKKGD